MIGLRFRLATILSCICMSMLSAVGSAALTPIADSPDRYDEPNLFGENPFPDNLNPSVLETLYGEQNVRRIDDSRDIAFRHAGEVAMVQAVARFSSVGDVLRYYVNRGEEYRIALRINTRYPNDPQGYFPPIEATPDGTIPLAESGPVFELGITGGLTSNPSRNFPQGDHLVTFEIVGNQGHPENAIGSFVLGWECCPDDDYDYQDLVFEISGVELVPEPASVLLCFVRGACVWLAPRKKR